MENTTLKTPPQNNSGDIAIMHSIKTLYALIYQTGKNIPKGDKLGIHAQAEGVALSVMKNIIRATFAKRAEKVPTLEEVRISLEVLKHLVRTEHELRIIDEKSYLRIAMLIVETSKMANGWIKYLSSQTQNPAKERD